MSPTQHRKASRGEPTSNSDDRNSHFINPQPNLQPANNRIKPKRPVLHTNHVTMKKKYYDVAPVVFKTECRRDVSCLVVSNPSIVLVIMVVVQAKYLEFLAVVMHCTCLTMVPFHT
eukprot:scaffold1562_cov170-Amphora_coffeaeformis.AAC.12